MNSKFVVTGLDCASCMEEIKISLLKDKRIDNVLYNSVNGTFDLDLNTKVDKNSIRRVVYNVESQAMIDFQDEFIFYVLGFKKSKDYNKLTSRLNELSEIERINCNSSKGKYSLVLREELDIKMLNSLVRDIEEEAVISFDEPDAKSDLPNIIVSILGVAIISILNNFFAIEPNVLIILNLAVYGFIGFRVLNKAFNNILNGRVFDENFLMSIATLGALFLGEYFEAIMVMLLYRLGMYFQDKALSNSKRSIKSLMDIVPEYATTYIDGVSKKVEPSVLRKGDIIIVKAGERVPVDGTVIEGNTYLDTSMLTGESKLRSVKEGDNVLSGVINKEGVIKLEVVNEFSDSAVSRIMDLVSNAGSRKSKSEQFITKFSRYYTPIVVLLALIIGLIIPIFAGSFPLYIRKSLMFLVISCPCALVISVPLGFFGGLGASSKNGILVKGSNYLEELTKLDTVVFDKTGTLTKGTFVIEKIIGSDKDKILKYATYGEWYSNHPIGLAIKSEEYKVDETLISDYEEIAGYGISLQVDSKEVLVGNEKLMTSKKINFTKSSEIGSHVYVAVGDKYLGVIIINDIIKDDAKAAITGLHKEGIKTIMLTGDNKKTASTIAREVGIGSYYSELLPGDKVDRLNDIMTDKKGSVMFVGDGINDAPALVSADVGVSMGGLGSDAAIEASDIVLMNDDPSKILLGIKIAKKTNKVVTQNIVLALGVKFIVMFLSLFGFANMWIAILSDVGISLIAILNSIRTTRIKE